MERGLQAPGRERGRLCEAAAGGLGQPQPLPLTRPPTPHPKLLQAGTWTTLRKGATLQEEGQPSASVFLLVSGGADVAVGGKKVLSRKGKHQFIG